MFKGEEGWRETVSTEVQASLVDHVHNLCMKATEYVSTVIWLERLFSQPKM